MFFSSDNWAGVHPAVAEALNGASHGFDAAYGAGEWAKRVAERFNSVFEREVSVFFVGTGSAANALALASVARPGGVAFSHAEAHVTQDECGAPEYFSGGGRIHPVPGGLGRIDPDRLRQALDRYPPSFIHAGQPSAITITQATEVGTVYSPAEIRCIAEIAREHDVPLHMDGARFANALVNLGVSPAEMTWKSGVDLLSFGGTKNGCWCAEAVILFDTEKARDFAFFHKRGAQLFSKSRFIAAQFEAYLSDELWLRSARHANLAAARLATALSSSNRVRLAWQPEANEVFAIMPRKTMHALRDAGAQFHDWHAPQGFEDQIQPDEELCRFVTSFATTDGHIASLAEALRQ